MAKIDSNPGPSPGTKWWREETFKLGARGFLAALFGELSGLPQACNMRDENVRKDSGTQSRKQGEKQDKTDKAAQYSKDMYSMT